MIDKEEVGHIAKLARLELTDQETQKMQKDLTAILDYFNILQNAKIKNKNDNAKLKMKENATRKDLVVEKPASLANNLVQSAPDKKDNYVKVKAIL